MGRRNETPVAKTSRPRKNLLPATALPANVAPGGQASTMTRSQTSTAAASFRRLDEVAALRAAVHARVEEGVRKVISAVPREHLYEALSTNSAVDALIYIVSRESAVAEAVTVAEDPLRAARARAAKRMTELLTAEGGPLGVEAVAERLRISRAAVDKRRHAGTLIGVADGGRSVLYPGWQFTETGLLPGIDTVLRELGVRDPWMRIGFFLSPEPDLGTRPLDALRSGRAADVVEAAKRFGRQGDDD
jgi:hypothetical protein